MFSNVGVGMARPLWRTVVPETWLEPLSIQLRLSVCVCMRVRAHVCVCVCARLARERERERETCAEKESTASGPEATIGRSPASLQIVMMAYFCPSSERVIDFAMQPTLFAVGWEKLLSAATRIGFVNVLKSGVVMKKIDLGAALGSSRSPPLAPTTSYSSAVLLLSKKIS